MIWIAGLAALPWVAVGALIAFGIREPRDLPPSPPGSVDAPGTLPSVRIVVPARNEARSIEACVRSLTRQEYPDFTIVVVDDRSTDGTGRLASGLPPGNARRIDIVAGESLPPAWLGKPWACAQGARAAKEQVLLFTDADTVHGPSLLRRSVAALVDSGVSAVSLLGRQELRSFGERLVQPQIFVVLGLRYRQLDRPLGQGQEREAIANGQYILVRRTAYEEVGGHEAVRGEVVEDLRLAQRLTAAGHRLILWTARDAFSTRMYWSLREVVDGWTKNVAIGARQSGGWWGRAALAAIVAYAALVWIAPPAILAATVGARLAGLSVPALLPMWAGGATGVGILTWIGVYRRFDVPAVYAFLYPLGAAVIAAIALRSGWRGDRRVEWKGRRYSGGRMQSESG